MSKIQVNDIVNHFDTGAPQFPKGIAVGGGGTLGLNVGTGASIYSPSDNVLTLGTNNVERLHITSAGNIGVGVTNPGALLSIPAGESNTPRLAIESAVDDNDFTITQYEDGNGTYTILGQNVKLNVGGNTTVLDSGHKTAGILLDARNHGSITFLTGGTNTAEERVKITSAGNVGIGTDNPSTRLHILGSDSYLTMQSSASDGNAGILFKDNTGAQNAVVFYDYDNDFLKFSTKTDDEAIRINTNQELLIGTDTDTGYGELVHISKKSTGTEGAGVRMSGSYSLIDDASQTFGVSNACLVFIAENNTGDGALFFCGYKSSTITIIADPDNRYANTDTDGKVCLYKSSSSPTVTLKNRLGSTKSFTIGKINTSD